MTKWMRATSDGRCGFCGGQIRIGDAMRITAIETVKQTMKRCADCAGGAPPDLAPLVIREPEGKRAEAITAIGQRAYADLRRDWKQKQAGDQ